MEGLQLKIVSTGAAVIAFAPRQDDGARLSLRDRMDVTSWHEPARECGYDRLVIHERAPCDPPEVDSFLSIYRRGESWSRWGIARRGGSVLAWCCVSGMDLGQFASVADALGSLLGRVAATPNRPSCEVIQAFA